jgi:hypothetical protein
MTKMKNIQVIDGAENCAFDIFAVTEIDFKIIFPDHEQDIEFAEELDSRENIEEICNRMWMNRIPKPEVKGIHGTLFYGLEDRRKYYPTKKSNEMTIG